SRRALQPPHQLTVAVWFDPDSANQVMSDSKRTAYESMLNALPHVFDVQVPGNVPLAIVTTDSAHLAPLGALPGVNHVVRADLPTLRTSGVQTETAAHYDKARSVFN